MIKDAVAVLDIGSSKVTVTLGERGVNGTFVIHSSCDVEYAGFAENDFSLDASDGIYIDEAINTAVETVKRNSDVKFNRVYVGVPAFFLQTRTISHSNSYDKKTKINANDVKRFIETGLVGVQMDGYYRIDTRAVYYTLSDGSVINNPIGKKSVNLSGILSITFCKSNFKSKIDSILVKLGVSSVLYVPSPLSESLYLFNEDRRNSYNILVDVGFSSSCFSVVYRNGIVFQSLLPRGVGGSGINAVFFQNLGFADMEYDDSLIDVVEDLKRKVNLGLRGGDYTINYNGQVYRFSVDRVNGLVNDFLTVLAEEISVCLDKCSSFLSVGTRINVTGGGISFIRGAVERLRDLLDKGVDVVYPNVPKFKKPNETSKFALLDYALKERN